MQIPVFIALYWVLLSAVELRQAPWILWIKDLSAPDPYFVLPVIYAITAYLQVKLSPTPITDPVQAKVMQIMPIAFSVLFIFFPSGPRAVLARQQLLQIAQQWHMNRVLEKEAAAKAASRRMQPAPPCADRDPRVRAAFRATAEGTSEPARRPSFASSGPNYKVCVQAFDDPDSPGVSCYVSEARTGGITGAIRGGGGPVALRGVVPASSARSCCRRSAQGGLGVLRQYLARAGRRPRRSA